MALSWQAPVNAGPELTHYEFRHGFASPQNPPFCDGTEDYGSQLDNPSAAFSGILGGRTEARQSVVNNYGQCAIYNIAGVNVVGTAAVQASAPLYIQHAPRAPGAVRVSLLVNSRISLSWGAVSEEDRLGAVISGYEILRKVDGGDFVSVGFSPGLSYVDNTPPLGAMVRYRARAQSSAGAGDFSGETAALEVPGERINYDEALEEELSGADPSLDTVRQYLSSGANANVTINGVAALLSAAEKGRADLVRALVLAGADVSARHPNIFDRNVAHLMAHNRVGEEKRLAWETARDVLLAFGNALTRRGASFDWDAPDSRGGRPLEYFYDNYLPASSDERSAMERMANYMIARGASCRESVKAEQSAQPQLCAGSPGPGAPDVFSAELGGAERTLVTLLWSAPFANASPVSGYKFWRVGGAPPAGDSDCARYDFPSITPATPTVVIAVSSAEALTAVDFLGAEGYGHCHRYGIAAINEEGAGAIAESAGFYAQFKPITMEPPRVTVGLDRVPVVSWDRLTNRVTERRGAVISQYQLQRRTGANGTWGDAVAIAQAKSSYREAVGNITAGDAYYYRIRALSSAGLDEDYSGPSAAAVIPTSGGACANFGEFQDSTNPPTCRVIGDSCTITGRSADEARFDMTFWRERSGRAVCGCLDGSEYLDAEGSRYCARSGEQGDPQPGGGGNELGDSENPAMIQTAIAACDAAGYVSKRNAVVGRPSLLGYEMACPVHTRRATPQGLEAAKSECVLATQEFLNDRRRPSTGHLLEDALFCHQVFPRLEGTQASVGVIPSGHNAANPYVYGECPPGQDLNRDLNRCVKDCSSGPSTNLGRGEVSGLELTMGESAEEDSCACPVGEFLDETACVASCGDEKRVITEEGGLKSCLDTANVGNAAETQCGGGRVVGTYAEGNLAVLCTVDRDINSLDSETVYASKSCWLSASPGFKASLPSPEDPNHIPSCADLPADFKTGTGPISFGECPDGKAPPASGADCVCEEEGAIEQGRYCFAPSGEVTLEDGDDRDALRELCEDAFRGKAEDAGNGQLVCSQVDANNTFCLLGSSGAFPCGGLFRHVRDCNFAGRPEGKGGRRALNPFWCGKFCELGYAAGDECVFTSSQFREAHGETAESLRTTLTVASGYAGALYTVNLARTIPGVSPLFSAAEPHLYSVGEQSGVVGVLAANSGEARSSLALIQVSHPQDERVYFPARLFLEWVDAPQYATLTHRQNPDSLNPPYTIPHKIITGNAHTLLVFDAPAGSKYELRRIDDAQRNLVASGSALGQYYRFTPERGGASLGYDNNLPPGIYELEVSFTHPHMAGDGELILRIPVEVTN